MTILRSALRPWFAVSCAAISLTSIPIARTAATQSSDEAPSALPMATIEAVATGRYEEARALLDQLLCRDSIERAQEFFRAGNPQDGLLAIDRALEACPDDPIARLERARGSLQLAEDAAAKGSGPLFVEGAFQDALAAFTEVPSTDPALGVKVFFGASRAAYMLGRGDEALRFAREGMDLLAEGAPARTEEVPPERTWAEASFLAYRDARGAEREAEVTDALFRETEDALTRLVARQPESPWVWTTYARLYQWDGQRQAAVERLHQGLDHLPAQPELLTTLIEIAAIDGAAPALAELDRFLARHPDVAEGYWNRARVRFDDGVAQLLAGTPRSADFPASEVDFVRCRELEPDYAAACKAYEVMCRNALGWCHFNAGELAEARDAFLSMEDVLAGGLAWAIEGQLLSGLQGLEFVAGKFNEQGDWGEAADVFEALREHQPEDSKWANNAGFFQRDAAVGLERVGHRLCRAAAGDPLPAPLAAELAAVHAGFAATPAECAALSERYFEEARERMRKSYAAYLEAARLAPNDVRIVNDTALIAVYYLHDDLERAEEILRRCIAMGAEQVQADDLSAEERFDLENAWGDAFQNLGVLYLAQHRDPETARGFLEQSLGLGDPRAFVRERLLPLCDASPEEVAAAEEEGLRPWAEPCH